MTTGPRNGTQLANQQFSSFCITPIIYAKRVYSVVCYRTLHLVRLDEGHISVWYDDSYILNIL
eukprot:scaffold1068_cov167-Amphora_coffeaeformis.AAC.18